MPFIPAGDTLERISWKEKIEKRKTEFIRLALMLEKYRKPFELILKSDMTVRQIQFELGIDETTCSELLEDLGKYYLAVCKDGTWTVTVEAKYFYNKYYVNKVIYTPGKAKCQHCGSLIPEKANPCPSCGEFRTWCAVCKMDIAPRDDILKCPFCNAPYHRDHLLEWIKQRGECPNCWRQLG